MRLVARGAIRMPTGPMPTGSRTSGSATVERPAAVVASAPAVLAHAAPVARRALVATRAVAVLLALASSVTAVSTVSRAMAGPVPSMCTVGLVSAVSASLAAVTRASGVGGALAALLDALRVARAVGEVSAVPAAVVAVATAAIPVSGLGRGLLGRAEPLAERVRGRGLLVAAGVRRGPHSGIGVVAASLVATSSATVAPLRALAPVVLTRGTSFAPVTGAVTTAAAIEALAPAGGGTMLGLDPVVAGLADLQEFGRDLAGEEQRLAIVEVDALLPRVEGVHRDHDVVATGAAAGFLRVLGRQREVQEAPAPAAQAVLHRAIGIASGDADVQELRRARRLAGLDVDRVAVQRAHTASDDLVARAVAGVDRLVEVGEGHGLAQALVQGLHDALGISEAVGVQLEVELLRLVTQHVREGTGDALDQGGVGHSTRSTLA